MNTDQQDQKSRLDRVRGCLLGGAIGDALGAPVEFMSRTEIRERFGPDGIVDFAPAYGRRGAITDDTQMTLFTAEGLLRGFVRSQSKGICSLPSVVAHAYLRWLHTQGCAAPKLRADIGRDGWLWKVKGLHSRRAPGKTCISALASLDHFSAEPASNDSKGAGAIMRVAPVAFAVSQPDVFQVAKEVSWITHGHPSGYLSAAAFAVILHAVASGGTLQSGIEWAHDHLSRAQAGVETLNAIHRALACADAGQPPHTAIPRIGQGWVGEEALGVAIYCALTSNDFEEAVRIAVNHDGDSDTTGSLVGQLMGAVGGEAVLPKQWLRALELRTTITHLADDLADFPNWCLDPYGSDEFTDRIWKRYPGW